MSVPPMVLELVERFKRNEAAYRSGQNRRRFHERALPDLDKNIKCGNALIGPDYFATQQEFSSVSSVSLWCNTDDLDTEEMFRINPFDWHAEFPEVFHHRATERTEKKNESNKGISSAPAVPLWCTPDGRFAYIVANKWMRANYGELLRNWLAAATNTHERTLLERQITATDHQIDQLVYTLCDLTEEEFALVEGSENR